MEKGRYATKIQERLEKDMGDSYQKCESYVRELEQFANDEDLSDMQKQSLYQIVTKLFVTGGFICFPTADDDSYTPPVSKDRIRKAQRVISRIEKQLMQL